MQFDEKSAEQSKKYQAGMRYNWTWTGIVGATLVLMGVAVALEASEVALALVPALVAEVVCMGFQQVVHQGGQAAVDAFVRMAVVIVTRKNGSVLKDDSEETPEEPAEPTPEGE